MLFRGILLAACSFALLSCGRIGYESEPATLAIDGGPVGTPPDATIYDAARTDDGSIIPPIDGGTGTATNLLVQKSGEPDWNILSGPKLGGAWARLEYEQSGPTFRFRMEAQGLPSNTQYLLVQFNDPWPGVPAEDIAPVTSDAGGNINLDWSEHEFNRDLLVGENKVWLVLAGHVDTANDEFTSWSPNDYLFEVDFLSYDDTDL